MDRPQDIEQFIRERDEMLLKLDIDAAQAFTLKWNGPPDKKVSRQAQLAGIHKARTAAKTLPKTERLVSVAWLQERGLTHFADDLGPIT